MCCADKEDEAEVEAEERSLIKDLNRRYTPCAAQIKSQFVLRGNRLGSKTMPPPKPLYKAHPQSKPLSNEYKK